MTHILSSLRENKTTTNPQERCHVLVFENQPHALNHFQITWQPWVFNSPQYAHYQSEDAQLFTFILTNLAQTQALAFFHLFVKPHQKTGNSPALAPFGGLEIKPKLPPGLLDYFVQEMGDFCQKLSLESCQIKLFPNCYDAPNAKKIANSLRKNGFKVVQAFENQHIVVSDAPFQTQLHASERRRLQKCERAGFVFEEWVQPDLAAVYAFIAKNRQALGYAITFDYAALVAWFGLFSDQYHLFCVKNGQQIVALTVAVRVGSGVLYNFCPADCLHYRAFSPTVLLTAGLYHYCQQNAIQILDMGVSIDANGQPKESLQRFKCNLGAKSSQKLIFAKQLSPNQNLSTTQGVIKAWKK